jgi:Ca-activated chloride channel homolog
MKSPRVTLALALALLVCAGGAAHPAQAQAQTQVQAQAPTKTPQRGQIRVEVNLVSVLASVLDKSGRPVTGLTRDQFELSEEGRAQKIERFEAQTGRPLDLALMVDTSLSQFSELKFEGEAAARFIRLVVRPGDALSVYEFSDAVTQLSPYTDSVQRLEDTAKRLESGAGTALYDAVLFGSQGLGRRPRDRRRVLILVTDAGEATSRTSFDEARRAAIVSQALLYTIVIRAVPTESGLNTAGEHAMQTITDSTGGALFYLDSMKQLDGTFEQINNELRTQYLIGYYPDPVPAAGAYRHVQLKVKGGENYTLEYRKGYFAAVHPASNGS